ncbi:DUF4262 domain-containing protein [Agromyces albus]|uniref:DUF4262 domain-containing protein n=1 Tax=Agromyces albus TaxID=205332 RepID=A0A4Q2L1E6_9MICO|nr:DUF4262 domain-containing protein [Agromyces albus]
MSNPRDQALADMKVLVHRHGWAVRHVLADAKSARAAFSYTAGLAARGWPETYPAVVLPHDYDGCF